MSTFKNKISKKLFFVSTFLDCYKLRGQNIEKCDYASNKIKKNV